MNTNSMRRWALMVILCGAIGLTTNTISANSAQTTPSQPILFAQNNNISNDFDQNNNQNDEYNNNGYDEFDNQGDEYSNQYYGNDNGSYFESQTYGYYPYYPYYYYYPFQNQFFVPINQHEEEFQNEEHEEHDQHEEMHHGH